MNKELLNLINEFKNDKRLLSFDEAAIKQAVILRILNALNWNPFNIDEVYPEYSVGGKRVDYSLRYNNRNKVFIEVKKAKEDLERHQEQLLNYSFQEGIRLAVLTNGISWWFYLPLREGSWEQRKFYTIEIYDQESEDVAEKFEEFLLKENVISDKAVENAENLYKSRQKQYLIKDTLPKAWKRIITEPDELLVDLLAETTEKLCGYKPDGEVVEQFLIGIIQEGVNQPKKKSHVSSSSFDKASDLASKDYTGKIVEAFTIKGKRYIVHSWKEMLVKVCEDMSFSHKAQFDKVLSLKGRKRPYFTRNPHELRAPEEIDDTGIYVETNLSANGIVRLTRAIMTFFGYNEDDISIEVKQ